MEDPYFVLDVRRGSRKGTWWSSKEAYQTAGVVFLILVIVGVWGGVEPPTAAPNGSEEKEGVPHGVQPAMTGEQPAMAVRGHEEINTQRGELNTMIITNGYSDTAHYSESHMEVSGVNYTVVRTCPSSQPLVRLFPNYFRHPEFEGLRNSLRASADMQDSSLSQDNFGNTKGWMIRFSEEGIARVRSHPKFHMVMPYFDKARNPEANAFVVNYLICNQPPEGENAVEMHLDNSVAMTGGATTNYTIVAHQVNVLYLDVPEGMKGGDLEVWPFERGTTELDKTVVSPGENLMAEFRGDSFHRVGKLTLPDGKPRVGIVFEQYKITEKFYSYLIPFCVGDDCLKIAAGELVA